MQKKENDFMFDVDRVDLYKGDESDKRTRMRLIKIAELGFSEVAIAEFGIKGVLTGFLY